MNENDEQSGQLVVGTAPVADIGMVWRDFRRRSAFGLLPGRDFLHGRFPAGLFVELLAIGVRLFSRQSAFLVGIGTRVSLQELLQDLFARLLGESAVTEGNPNEESEGEKSLHRPGIHG